MKISKLPKEIREKALKNQKNEIDKDYDKESDILEDAFDWMNTPEGADYWIDIENGMIISNFENFIQPKQYQIGIDTIQRAEANLTKDEILVICKFNIDKYCWRKKDQDKEDFKKIIDYANWALKNL